MAKTGRAAVLRNALAALKHTHSASNTELVDLLVTGRGSSSKGGSFERDFCKALSMWWSNGVSDDLFWRTSGSGARATTRSKQGKRTIGHYGDVTATSPAGKAFMDLFTIELKRGYNWHNIQDALDRQERSKPSTYEDFISQAINSSKEAGTPNWMLVVKRDRRQSYLFMNVTLGIMPSIGVTIPPFGRIFGMPLSRFFDGADPEDFC